MLTVVELRTCFNLLSNYSSKTFVYIYNLFCRSRGLVFTVQVYCEHFMTVICTVQTRAISSPVNSAQFENSCAQFCTVACNSGQLRATEYRLKTLLLWHIVSIRFCHKNENLRILLNNFFSWHCLKGRNFFITFFSVIHKLTF